MRPLIIQAPAGSGNSVFQIAQKQNAQNLSIWKANDGDSEVDIVLAFISNGRVEQFISDLDGMDDVHITLFPQGVLAMYPPASETPEQVTNVEARSPIEIFLSGLQSIGSWKGFVGYAVVSSIIVWIGLFTNTTFLLVGAMMIAPFAGPAMNMAIATARGDWRLMRRSLLRYGAAIAITVTCTFLLSVAMRQETTTALMISTSQVSSVALLLAVAAGAAGSISLVQSERSSLVSGAAAGMLVAASLAPPTGLIGMAISMGEWTMVKSGAFLLVLQLAGINLSGSLIFFLFGLRYKGPRYKIGKKVVVILSLVATVIVLGGLAAWQFSNEPNLQRSSLSKRAEEEIHKVVTANKTIGLVEGTARFTGSNIAGQNTLLCVVYVQKFANNTLSEDRIKAELRSRIMQSIQNRMQNVTPVVTITVLEAPPLR